MIILQAANFVSPTSGGIRTALDALARGYAAAGHRPIQVFPGRQERHTYKDGVLRVELPSVAMAGTGYRVIARRRRLLQLLEQWSPDSVEVSDKLTLQWLGGWSRAHGVRALLWSHERLDALAGRHPSVPLPRARVDAVNRRLARHYDAVVAPSAWAAQEFARLGGVPTHVVPLGVDLATFHPARRNQRLRRSLTSGQVLLAAAVRLSPEKEPGLLIDTLRRLRAGGVDATLAVAGGGSSRAAVTRAARGLPVRMLGHVRDPAAVASLLATADVVIAPGPVETFGLSALEALACGTPVVARRSGAVGEVLGGAGLTAYGHGGAMASAVATLLRRDVDQRRAQARARAQDYPWAATVAALLGLHGAAPPVPAAAGAPHGHERVSP